MIEIPLRRLWELVAEDKASSDMILGAFMARRAILVDLGAGIKLIGSRFSSEARRLREFLARNRMPYVRDSSPLTPPAPASPRPAVG